MRYLILRVAQGIIVIWAAFTITFVVLYLLPSDPVEIMLSQGGDAHAVDPDAAAALRAQHGLDKGLAGQYLHALSHAARADFGRSIVLGEPVTTLVVTALPQTLLLTAAAAAIAVGTGVTVALGAVASGARWLRTLLTNLPPLLVSLPSFWVGIVLMQIFSFRFTLLPAVGNGGWSSLVLPAFALSLPTAAMVAQILHNNVDHVLHQAFIEVLRAKGVGERAILFRHALRVAALPALTLVGMNIAAMLAGAIVIETVFSRSGLGRLTEGAVRAQDIPVVQGVVVLSAVIFVAVNLIVDLLYPLLDPRVTTASKTND